MLNSGIGNLTFLSFELFIFYVNGNMLEQECNQVKVFFVLVIMAQITGKKAGMAYDKIVNAHIYEDQLMQDVQLKREPLALPKLIINPEIKSLEGLETWVTMDDFKVEGYECHEAIKYPFTV